jgi:hypothetical protein
MKVVAFLILFLFTTNTNAQNITIKVLGKANYVEYAEINGVIISINKSELDKKTKLSDTLSLIGISNKLVPITGSNIGNKNKFRIEEKDLNLFDKLLIACVDLKVKIDKIYYKLPEHRLENQDDKAILALHNATSQARVIANNLNYQIVKILNIDDDTLYADPFYDNIDMDSENGKLTLKILELLRGRNSIYKTESLKPKREWNYTILVTYELKKNKWKP